jgi:hypothetical protein
MNAMHQDKRLVTRRFIRGARLPIAAAAVLLVIVVAASNGREPPTAVAPADIDLASCQSFHNRDARAATLEEVHGILGLDRRVGQWTAGRSAPDVATDFTYRVAFRREIALGAILVDATGEELRLLRADAPYPGDPWNAEHWTKLPASRRSGGCLVVLPAGTKTRAVLLTERRERGSTSAIRYLRLFTERLHNVAPLAQAYSDQEYMPPNTDFVPEPATNVPEGRGRWVNVGKNDRGFIPAPPVSEVAPSWFMLTWRDEQPLTGLWLRSNVEKFELHTYDGPADVNPRAGTPDEWRKVRTYDEQAAALGTHDTARWIRFPQPVSTRGLRLRLVKTSEGPIASIVGLHAFVNVGDRPVPEARTTTDEPPPFRIPYELPADGNLSLAVNGPDGRRARNLFSRATQSKGTHSVSWDLKDENGNFVAPGTYRLSGLTWPDLRLRYETTVYPNVPQHAPNNSPWLNGHEGSGGWLADHSTPVGVCAVGDRVFLSAPCAESGVSLIECDLEGRKRWGHHSFAAWTGPRFLASDGKEVFAGAQILNTTTDAVWAVDLATRKVRQVFALTPTSKRLRGQQGLAARDGKVYVSIRANESWLGNAAGADDVDMMASLPLQPEQRQPRYDHEVVPDPRGDFLRLFRLGGTPPGGATQFTLEWLDTPGGRLPQQHIVLAFKQPMALGSVVFPVPAEKGVRVLLSALKPNAPYPPDPEKAEHWTPFTETGKNAWDAVPAPEGTLTRALRITFAKGRVATDDPLDKALDGKSDESLDFGTAKGAWKGRLEGMKLLRRRFVNVAREATVRVNSGTVAADGTWDAKRDRPLTESDPGIFALEWKAEQPLRGLAIKEIDGALTRIDVWTGPADKPLDLAAADNWTQVAEYRQERRDHHTGFPSANPTARYVDGYIDFGKELRTRAVRLRVVRQWADNAPDSRGIRADLGGQKLDPNRCRVWGVAALKYIGGEAPIDTLRTERIEVYDAARGKLLSEIPIARPADIAFNQAGELYTVSGTEVVRVDLAGRRHQPIVADLKEPTDLAFDRNGNLYVFDGARERCNVRVYDRAGKYLRSIGTPGGFRVGAWDPKRMGDVTSIDVDSRDQLWVVESQYWPKRVTLWGLDGSFKKEFLGNTAYGGGGVIDPEDKTRLFYGPLEFAIDWKTGASRLKNLTWLQVGPYRGDGMVLDSWNAGEVPIRANGRTYLVPRPNSIEQPCGIVFLYEKDHIKAVAAVGQAMAFHPLKKPEVLVKLGGNLTDRKFIWVDRNGDGEVQADEVTLTPKLTGMGGVTNFNRDLSVQSGPLRYQVKEFLANGAPVYEEKLIPGLKGRSYYRLDTGNYYRVGEDRLPERVESADGKPVWTHPSEGWGVGASQHGRPYRPDQVISQFAIVAHETAHAGGLGEFFIVNTNVGAWNIWTADGLLVGPIFRDMRAPQARPWSMQAHERGMMLDGVTAGEEHFSAYFCRTADNRYYVVAGHNHISVLEVLGIDQFKRVTADIKVTADDLRKAQEWDAQRKTQEVYVRAPVLDVYRLRKPPRIDGKLDDWGPPNGSIPEGAELRVGYDDTHLYLAYSARNLGPLLNKGEQWDRLFKSGAAVDLQIATDPRAPNQRQTPQAGDLRLLLTFMGKEPAAVLYRPVVPGTPKEKRWRVTSPVGEAVFDEVVQLKDVRLARTTAANAYIVEAAVPLAALGVKPTPGLRLKMDWGMLVSGPEGTEVFRRIYWANKATTIVSDAPSEARLHPNLWGYALFHDYRPGAEEKLNEIAGPGEKTPPKEVKKDVTDILDDLKPKSKPKR